MILNKFISIPPRLQRFCKETTGAVAVEMTLVLIPFMVLFFFIAELCTTVYVSVSIDVAMAEAMRFTTASSTPSMDTYETIFKSNIQQRIGRLPMLKYSEDDVKFTTRYCAGLEQLEKNSCSATINQGTLYPVAIFTITYRYDSIFFPMPDKLFENDMARKGIYIMEHQRARSSTPTPPTTP